MQGKSLKSVWNRLRHIVSIACAISLFALATSSFAQGNMTITFKPFRNVRHLAETVTFGIGEPVVPGAIVADCDSTYGRVLASTKTDAGGHFSFLHAKLGSKHYIKIDFPAFQEVHMPVKIWPFAKAELRVWLSPGT